MRIKQVNPPFTYVVLVTLARAVWNKGIEDGVIQEMEDFIDETNGWDFDEWNLNEWIKDHVDAGDFTYAFDTVAERRKFVKHLRKHLDKQIKQVTTIDLNN